jgi:hypothetical protein
MILTTYEREPWALSRNIVNNPYNLNKGILGNINRIALVSLS